MSSCCIYRNDSVVHTGSSLLLGMLYASNFLCRPKLDTRSKRSVSARQIGHSTKKPRCRTPSIGMLPSVARSYSFEDKLIPFASRKRRYCPYRFLSKTATMHIYKPPMFTVFILTENTLVDHIFMLLGATVESVHEQSIFMLCLLCAKPGGGSVGFQAKSQRQLRHQLPSGNSHHPCILRLYCEETYYSATGYTTAARRQ